MSPYLKNADLPKSVRDALPEHGQTIFRKTFNSASEQYGTENEARLMKVAWAAVKNVYEKKDDKWVLKEGKKAESSILEIGSHDHRATMFQGENGSDWIPIAKVAQPLKITDAGDLVDCPEFVYPTAEGFEKAVEMFKGLKQKGYVGKNHSEILNGLEVIDQKFEDPFLYAKFNAEGAEAIKDQNSTGRSIDATIFNIDGHLLTDFFVPGVSVLYEPHIPGCTPEMGCASITEKASNPKIDFDIVVLNNRGELVKVRAVNLYLDKDEMKNEKIVKDQLLAEVAYLGQQQSCSFYKHDPKLKIGDVIPEDVKPVHTIHIAISAKGKTELEYHEGGGKEKMGKEGEEPVTFTGEQTKEMIASAVAEVTEKLDNAHAVVITDLEKTNETKIKELGTEHETAIKTAEEAAFKRAQARAVFMQKFGLKDDSELMKSYDEVKTVEDMQGLVNSMEIPMAIPPPAGISSANSEGSKVVRIEEIGSFDPVKGEWIPSYREEVKE